MKNIIIFLFIILWCQPVFAIVTTTIDGATATTLENVTINKKNANAVVAGTPRILPLGDSITEGVGGDTDQFGYRDHLQDHLGIGVYNFVGQYNNPFSDATYDINHSGQSGNETSQILARLIIDLPTYLPAPNPTGTKVLILAGTNDIGHLLSSTDAVTNIHTMLDDIEAHDPTITIYVSLLLPRTSIPTLDYYNQVIAFNNLLRSMLQNYQVDHSNVVIVDAWSAYTNPANCNPTYAACLADGTHPNDTPGYRLLSDLWFHCIQSTSNNYCNGN